jgi:ribosomal protein S18 acetylase RimI-like enzyme
VRRLDDWARVPAAEMAALYRLEHERWARALDWDTTDTLEALERARLNGRVPGFVARQASGAVAGWTYYVLQGSELQIGALVASSPGTTAGLLDAVLGSAAATVASRTLFFAHTEAPGIADALASRGFTVTTEHYLSRPLDPSPATVAPLFTWHDDDVAATADLLQDAYGGPDPTRAFAPGDGLADWHGYVQQLTRATGCGRFLPALSPVLRAEPGRLDGVALVTAVSGTSAHLAQLAVRAGRSGDGRGRRLLAAALARAQAAGYARISLLVNGTNARARRLYASTGFEARGTFVSATRPRQPAAQRRPVAPAA